MAEPSDRARRTIVMSASDWNPECPTRRHTDELFGLRPLSAAREAECKYEAFEYAATFPESERAAQYIARAKMLVVASAMCSPNNQARGTFEIPVAQGPLALQPHFVERAFAVLSADDIELDDEPWTPPNICFELAEPRFVAVRRVAAHILDRRRAARANQQNNPNNNEIAQS